MSPRDVHRITIRLLSVALAIIGIALVVQALSAGGVSVTRLLLGVLFIAAGSGRLYLQARGNPRS